MALHDSGRPLEFSEDAHFWPDIEVSDEMIRLVSGSNITPKDLRSIISDIPLILKRLKEILTDDEFKIELINYKRRKRMLEDLVYVLETEKLIN